ncbi:MAG TPA: hypothetical protein V6C65_17910 [Allocoleopsis sp.]
MLTGSLIFAGGPGRHCLEPDPAFMEYDSFDCACGLVLTAPQETIAKILMARRVPLTGVLIDLDTSRSPLTAPVNATAKALPMAMASISTTMSTALQ